MNFNAIRVKLFIPPTNLYTLITGNKRFDHGIILNDDDELIIKDDKMKMVLLKMRMTSWCTHLHNYQIVIRPEAVDAADK